VKVTLLLVTWIAVGQPPSSYQVPFTSSEACEAARIALMRDAQRVSNELILPNGVPPPPEGYDVNAPARLLAVSAVCAAN
jgi:hypothetical protein